jgi:hypothetical protein
MSRQLTNAKRIMLEKSGQAKIDPTTIMTEDSFDILLSKKCLQQIGNIISRTTKVGMTTSEARELIGFIQKLPARNYLGLKYAGAQVLIAEQFLSRDKFRLTESQLHTGDLINPPLDMHEYQKTELNNLTNDENSLKLSAHPDRRGNAIIDEDRIKGTHIMADRSTPNNILSGATNTEQAIYDASKETTKLIRTFQNFLNPESIEQILARNRNSWTTYNSVVLPHQVVPLDSRYRLPAHTPEYEYKWNLHTAGTQGHIGDIRMMDTLKEIIQMKVCPFWIPIGDIDEGYYGKIRMLVKEFTPQSTQFTEFRSDDSIFVRSYHFEFRITQRDIGRFYLEPECGGIFKFRKPFARPETITVSFTSPFQQIIPAIDNMFATVSNTNPAVFTTAPNQLATGDLVYVQLFNSPDDDLNDIVNRPQGYIITRLSATTFSIPVDLSSLANPEFNVQVYFGSKRLIIPLEFTSLEQ